MVPGYYRAHVRARAAVAVSTLTVIAIPLGLPPVLMAFGIQIKADVAPGFLTLLAGLVVTNIVLTYRLMTLLGRSHAWILLNLFVGVGVPFLLALLPAATNFGKAKRKVGAREYGFNCYRCGKPGITRMVMGSQRADTAGYCCDCKRFCCFECATTRIDNSNELLEIAKTVTMLLLKDAEGNTRVVCCPVHVSALVPIDGSHGELE